ncbi:MAG: hypothetical protein BKP49_06960 [Treponema sp. CETP13]|nr:MAG: hypothetical protein BKP49_06960 [Treponema sp. CETP13]
MKKIVIGFLICGILTFGAFAQDIANSDDELFGVSTEDDMFGDDSFDDMFEDASISDEEAGDVSDIFGDKIVRAGGTISASVDISSTWYDPLNSDNYEDSDFWLDGLEEFSGSPDLAASFFVDARPYDNLRGYASIDLGYPYAVSSMVTSTGYDSSFNAITSYGSVSLPNLDVSELFVDVAYNDNVSFRAGKHTVTWGTGYFYSPTSDIINASAIDVEDPDETVDANINIRTQITFPGTQNCLWLYVVPEIDSDGDTQAQYTRFAGKYDFLVNDWELGLGAWAGYDDPLKALFTASGSVIDNSITVFGESVFSWGTDDEWDAIEDGDSDASDFADLTPVFQATVGTMYTWDNDENNKTVTLSAQYLFDSNAGAKIEDYTSSEVFNPQHSLAFILSRGALFNNEDWSATLFGMGSINNSFDGQTAYGLAKATVSYDIIDHVSISAGPSFTWIGTDYSEYLKHSIADSYGITVNELETAYASELSDYLNSNTAFTISVTIDDIDF